MRKWWETTGVTTELGLVLGAIGRGLAGRFPTPDLLEVIASEYQQSVPGHRVVVEYKPRPPKGTVPRPIAVYVIWIGGRSVNAGWQFSHAELAEVLKWYLNRIEDHPK